MSFSEKAVNWLQDMVPSIVGAVIVLLAGMLLNKIVLGIMNKGLKLKQPYVDCWGCWPRG